MSEKALRQRIDDLLHEARQRRNALAIARYTVNERRQQTEAATRQVADCEQALKNTQQAGREAVFQLMLRLSPRRFLRFLRDYGVA